MIEGRFDVAGAAGPRRFFEALDAPRLAHGYLFTGAPGVGKKTFALRLAQSLLCETPKSTLLGYCGTCRSCTSVQAQAHPDLYLHVGELKIGEHGGGAGFGEDDASARTLVRQLAMHSYAGGRRVFILGDAEFTREAGNALLKFFEEPPDDVLLIVTTSSPGRLLATIRSRLVELVFPLLTAAEIVSILEAEGIAPADARRGAAVAHGSVARARALITEGDEGLRETVAGWYADAVRGRATESLWAKRHTLDDGLELAKAMTRDRLAIAVAGEDVPLLAPDQRERLAELPPPDPRALARVLVAIGDAQRTASTNVGPELVANLVRMALTTAK